MLRQARLAGREIMFSTGPFVRPSLFILIHCCKATEHNILKANEPILLPIGANDPRGRRMKRSILRVKVKGQGHMRPKLDVQAWRKHLSRLIWVG